MLNPVKISCPAINRLQNSSASVAVHVAALDPLLGKLLADASAGRPVDGAQVIEEFAKLQRHVKHLEENAAGLEGVRTINFRLRHWGERNAHALKLANVKLLELGLPPFDAEQVDLPNPVAPAPEIGE